MKRKPTASFRFGVWCGGMAVTPNWKYPSNFMLRGSVRIPLKDLVLVYSDVNFETHKMVGQ